MKNLLLVCLTLLLCNDLSLAQTEKNPKFNKLNIYGEVGSILLVSSATVNLEVPIGSVKSGEVNWYARVGYGTSIVYFGSFGNGGLGALTMLKGKGKHHFELSGGVFIGYDKEGEVTKGTFLLPLLDCGYRYQKPGKSFLFRAKIGILGAGIGLGYAF